MAYSPEEIYYKFLVKINKGSTEFNISCDRAVFSSLINEEKHKWVKKSLLKDKDSILIDQLQEIVKEKQLLPSVISEEFTEFTFEDDYYETIGGYCKVEKSKCKKNIRIREIKNQDKNLLYSDENNRPDFDFEWSFFTLQGNSLRVYKKDFKILSSTIQYYKVLDEFEVEGFVKIDGSNSVNKPLKLADNKIDEIIDEAALEYSRIYENQIAFQLSKERTNNN